ncbi:methionyl aminopeptidase [Halteromyces radiatus]|uniref:methionyl aminopeptidase n=1 Tax=Halteromyces radiatus TaxID=101107 RepID=UPI002220DC01|nr:methionyl aminopeptidase [Halteromyces radiatus]KAI8097598.1 methionyl aminopeptidase [Halteromyces radiatus]
MPFLPVTRRHFSLSIPIKSSCFIHTNAITLSPPRKESLHLTSRQKSNWGRFRPLTPSSLNPVPVRSRPRLDVPSTITRPAYADLGSSSEWAPSTPYNTPKDLIKLRASAQLAKKILYQGGDLCKVGTTTNDIDKILHNAIIAAGAYPSPLNYMGFPKSICTSVNNIIAHGIPDERPLENGDIINIDVTVYLDGFHGDTSATFQVGEVDKKGQDLIECTKESLTKAIAVCGPGVPFREIGRVISEYASANGYTVSDELSGHGIGREFHCLPLIYHHVNDEDGVMTPGMVFTIEPVLSQGSSVGLMWPDEWTIATIDQGRSAQFEHMIAITEDGVEILTE